MDGNRSQTMHVVPDYRTENAVSRQYICLTHSQTLPLLSPLQQRPFFAFICVVMNHIAFSLLKPLLQAGSLPYVEFLS